MTKEEEILKAAEEEFFKNGYDATSTATIARNTGVTHAMVNYYFRTKERLFIQILDNHVYELLRSLKPLMQDDGNVISVAVKAAEAIFDGMNRNRRFPFLLSDIARTHPDFLRKYKDAFNTVCRDSIGMHSERLKKSISEGLAEECTMNDIYNSVVTLAVTPFLTIPLLENVAEMSDTQIDSFLQSRKEEMIRILTSRYSIQAQ